MESERKDTLVGAVIDGRYTIDRPLASGGMGSVYLAQQRNLARPVAVKVVIGADEELVERFRREADSLAEVSHPAIVEVHDFIRAEEGHDRCYLVMSYVEGEDLEDYLERQPHKRLSVSEAVSLITPIVSALVQLHAAGIVHRDIKPANIVRFQGADGRPAVKLVDFGIARRSVDEGLTSAGYIIGTPPYMAPETLMAKPHTPVADVYAVGATLYELLTGGAPFGNGRLHEVMGRALQEPVTPPPGLAGTTLGDLLLQMLDKDEGRRPDALKVLDTLEHVQDELAAARVASGASLVAPAPSTPGPASPTQSGRDQATVHLTPRPVPGAATGPNVGPPAGTAPHPQTEPPPRSGPLGTAPTALAPSTTSGTAAAVVPRPGTAATLHPSAQAGGAPDASGARRRRQMWIWLGPLLAVPLLIVVVTLTLVFGGFGRPSDEATDEAADGPPSTASTEPEDPEMASARRRTAARRPPRRRAVEDNAESGRTLGKACKSQKDAKRFFARAKAANKKTRAGQDEALRYYRAVLYCGYAHAGQRRWAARLMSNIYRNRRACRSARALWQTYQRLTRAAGKRPKPFPGCH